MSRRAVSAAMATCLVVASLLALQHEATVAHVRDRATGELVHVRHLAEHHQASSLPHLHGQAGGDDDDMACSLAGALHHIVVVAQAVQSAVLLRQPLANPRCITTADTAPRLYRLAPKTSPPAAA